jgi:hypothetical protein
VSFPEIEPAPLEVLRPLPALGPDVLWLDPATQTQFIGAADVIPIAHLALWALNHGYPSESFASALGVPQAQSELIMRDIEAKRRGTRTLHFKPLVRRIPEVDACQCVVSTAVSHVSRQL